VPPKPLACPWRASSSSPRLGRAAGTAGAAIGELQVDVDELGAQLPTASAAGGGHLVMGRSDHFQAGDLLIESPV
jgi:hypothetical protein